MRSLPSSMRFLALIVGYFVVAMGPARSAALPDIVLDSEQTTGISPHSITISGSWTDGSGATGKHGALQKHDNNVHAAGKWVQYTPSISEAGWYQVFLWNHVNTGYANNTDVEVGTADGVYSNTVNQRQDGGKWSLFGTPLTSAGTTNSFYLP